MTEFNSLNPYKQFIFPKNNGVDRDLSHVYFINQNTSNLKKDKFQKQDTNTQEEKTEEKAKKQEKQTLLSKYKRELTGGAIALVLCGALMLLCKKGKPSGITSGKPAAQAGDDAAKGAGGAAKGGGDVANGAGDAAKGGGDTAKGAGGAANGAGDVAKGNGDAANGAGGAAKGNGDTAKGSGGAANGARNKKAPPVSPESAAALQRVQELNLKLGELNALLRENSRLKTRLDKFSKDFANKLEQETIAVRIAQNEEELQKTTEEICEQLRRIAAEKNEFAARIELENLELEKIIADQKAKLQVLKELHEWAAL